MNNLKMSDAMFVAAEATIKMAEKSGIKISLSDLYIEVNAKSLATVAAIIKGMVIETSGKDIVVTNN